MAPNEKDLAVTTNSMLKSVKITPLLSTLSAIQDQHAIKNTGDTTLTTLYGIKNCDTVKKARKWLEQNGQDYTFHDVRADGLDADMVGRWCDALGWEKVLNKRSTTWKQLSDSDKDTINEASAKALLLEHPTLIKRPVLEQNNNALEVGFKADRYAELLGA